MKIVVVDPRSRAIELLDESQDPKALAQRRVGRGRRVEWSIILPSWQGKAGLGVALDEDGLTRLDQRFFRLAHIRTTFPGTCLFFGLMDEALVDVPDWFLDGVTRKMNFCPRETVVLRIEEKAESFHHPSRGLVPVLTRVPVFGQRRGDGEEEEPARASSGPVVSGEA